MQQFLNRCYLLEDDRQKCLAICIIFNKFIIILLFTMIWFVWTLLWIYRKAFTQTQWVKENDLCWLGCKKSCHWWSNV